MALEVLLAESLLVHVLRVLDVLGALVERLAAQLALELVLVRHLMDAELGVGVEHSARVVVVARSLSHKMKPNLLMPNLRFLSCE